MGVTNTGNTICRVGSSVTSSNAAGNPAWTNAGNITLDDGSFATSTDSGVGTTTNWLKASNFGFAIPVDSKILAALVSFRGASSGALFNTVSARIGLDDANVSNPSPQTITNPTTGLIRTFGTLSYQVNSTFGLNLTPYNVNTPSFLAELQSVFASGTVFVDAVWMSIIYTDAVTATSGNTQIRVQTRMAGY